MKKFFTTAVLVFISHAIFACTAGFTWVANPINNSPLNVTFTNTSTTGALLGQETHTLIYFGDNSAQDNNDLSDMSHNYSAPGTYTVTMVLSIINNPNDSSSTVACTDSITETVTVGYQPCATTAAVSLSSGTIPSTATFTSTNPAGTPGMSYEWDFGDASPGDITANPVHTYTAAGTYTVMEVSFGGGCSDTNSIVFTLNQPLDCSNNFAGFSWVNSSYSTAQFTNTSTAPALGQNVSYSWNFGDFGGYSGDINPSYTYYTAGTYTVILTTTWSIDSFATTCTDTESHVVTVGNPAPPPNVISGNIYFSNSPSTGDFKVWLIQYSAIDSELYAVDSMTVTANSIDSGASYEFDNEPNGTYMVKAFMLNQTSGTSGYMPTYFETDLYWYNANNINHTGGNDVSKNIHLQYGTVPSGSGFIGGNIITGANRNTNDGDPVPNMLVYLRNSSNAVVGYTYTNASGQYSFSNIADGTYSIYPEDMNYTTVAYTDITITGGQSVTAANFRQHTVSMYIDPITTGVANVTAANSVKVYPNPSKGLVSLIWEQTNAANAHIVVTDVTGRTAFETERALSAGSGATQLDMTNLKAGLYFINVTTGAANYVQSIVISK